jgi:hypothetical protein
MEKKENRFVTLETFLMNDQPFTCPCCGARCEEVSSFFHTTAKLLIQQCLNKLCGFICGEEEGEEFLNSL